MRVKIKYYNGILDNENIIYESELELIGKNYFISLQKHFGPCRRKDDNKYYFLTNDLIFIEVEILE